MAKAKQTSKSKSETKKDKRNEPAGASGDGAAVDTNAAARAAAAMLLNRDAGFASQSGGTIKQLKQDMSRSALQSLGVVAGKGGAADAKYSNLGGIGRGSGGHHQKSGLAGNRLGVPRRTSNG